MTQDPADPQYQIYLNALFKLSQLHKRVHQGEIDHINYNEVKDLKQRLSRFPTPVRAGAGVCVSFSFFFFLACMINQSMIGW